MTVFIGAFTISSYKHLRHNSYMMQYLFVGNSLIRYIHYLFVIFISLPFKQFYVRQTHEELMKSLLRVIRPQYDVRQISAASNPASCPRRPVRACQSSNPDRKGSWLLTIMGIQTETTVLKATYTLSHFTSFVGTYNDNDSFNQLRYNSTDSLIHQHQANEV